jgi:hypothetical protein
LATGGCGGDRIDAHDRAGFEGRARSIQRIHDEMAGPQEFSEPARDLNLRMLTLPAPCSNPRRFFGWDLQVGEELLVIFGGGFLELLVPALHVVIAEARRSHDFNPFVFRHIFRSPEFVLVSEKCKNGSLMFLQFHNLTPDFGETSTQDSGRISRRRGTCKHQSNVFERQSRLPPCANPVEQVELGPGINAVARLRTPGGP